MRVEKQTFRLSLIPLQQYDWWTCYLSKQASPLQAHQDCRKEHSLKGTRFDKARTVWGLQCYFWRGGTNFPNLHGWSSQVFVRKQEWTVLGHWNSKIHTNLTKTFTSTLQHESPHHHFACPVHSLLLHGYGDRIESS
jgi:hypothetical protein